VHYLKISVTSVLILCEKCVTSGFRRGVNEIFALLGCYAALIGSYLPTFRENVCYIFNGHAFQKE
jgi:hypothetical protein